MNGEIMSTTAITIARPRSSPEFTMQENAVDNCSTREDSSPLCEADPLGLCPLGVKSTRTVKESAAPRIESAVSPVSSRSVGEFAKSQHEISDLLDNWNVPDNVAEPKLCFNDKPHFEDSSKSVVKSESCYPAVDTSLPSALTSAELPAKCMESIHESCHEQATAKSSLDSSVNLDSKFQVTKSNVNQTPVNTKDSASKQSLTGQAVESAKSVSVKPSSETKTDAPSKLGNFGRTGEPASGQRKNAGDASKAMTNVSIHFSKKALLEDSDGDEGMGIAISVTSVPSKETTASEKSSSLESVTEPAIIPSVDAETRANPDGGDVYTTPKMAVNGDASIASEPKSSKQSTDRRKKGWYSMLSTTYKSRSVDFKRIFKDVPPAERLIVDYSCALQRDILCHGRLYVSREWICFYANILRWETAVMIRAKDIVSISKEKTALFIPNAVQIRTNDDKTYFFASFTSRDKAFYILDRVRKCAVEDQPMSLHELWQWVHYSYGEDLGLSDHDDDYIPLTSEEKIEFQTQVQQKLAEQGGDGLSAAGSIADSGSVESVADMDSSAGENIPSERSRSKLQSDSSLDGSQKLDRVTHDLADDAGTESDVDDSSGSTKPDGSQPCNACSGHEHFEIAAMDEMLDIPVDTAFQQLFTDSTVFRNFVNTKKTFDVVLSSWPVEAEPNGTKIRNISYTLTLTNPLGPKTSQATERQIMQSQSRPGEFYLIDVEVINSKIPYGEDFYVLNRYCLSKVTGTKSRVRVTSQIRYRKNVWGFVKNIIDKNVTAGILESFSVLCDIMKQESNRNAPGRKRQKRRQNSSGRAIAAGPASEAVAVTGKREQPQHRYFNSDVLIRVLCVALITLMMFNTFLLYKLWSVESRLYGEQVLPSGPYSRSAVSDVDIAKLLNNVASLLDKLRETLAQEHGVYTAGANTCGSSSCS